MPKKTKKQKQLAQKHRSLQIAVPTQSTHQESTHQPAVQSLPTFSFPRTSPISTPVNHLTESSFDQSTAHIKKDIAKTVLLAAIACAILIGLSFVLH